MHSPADELPREGLLRIDGVACEEHGSLLPEMFRTPFSLDASVLTMLPMACGTCYEEHGLEHVLLYPPLVEWEPTDAPLLQHLAEVGHDPDARPPWYPVWHVRPAERRDGELVFRTGTKLSAGLS